MNDIPPTTKPAYPKTEPLRLHIPPHREMPGQRPDFSYFRLPPAGGFPRPAIDCPSVETHPLATALIRVLDDGDGRDSGRWASGTPSSTPRRCVGACGR